MAPFVQLLQLILFPISYPAGKLLDWALGKEHPVLLRRSELKTFVDIHSKEAGKGGELSHQETCIITGAMDLTQKTVKDAMTPISETFSLDVNSKLDMHAMTLVMSKGHSRIPVYSGSPRNIIGLILVKNLIFCRPEDETPIKNLIIRKIPRVYENWPLYEILKQFQKGHSHMAVVLQCSKEAESPVAYAGGTFDSLNIVTSINSGPLKNIQESSSTFEENRSVSRNESTISSMDSEFHSAVLQNDTEADNEQHQQSKRWEQEKLYLPTASDYEVIGIITMEDVMEEILQGDILDETDGYVHVQKNIRINLLPSRRSQSTSSRRASWSDNSELFSSSSHLQQWLGQSPIQSKQT